MCTHAHLLSDVQLCDPMTVAHQAPLSTGFSRQGCWGGWPFPPPGDLPDPGIEPESSVLAGRFFSTEPPGKLVGVTVGVITAVQSGRSPRGRRKGKKLLSFKRKWAPSTGEGLGVVLEVGEGGSSL